MEVNPPGWKTALAYELGEFVGGSGFALHLQGVREGEYPFFKVSDFSNRGNERCLIFANNYVSERIRRRMSAKILPRTAIVFPRVGAAIFLERKRMLAQASCIDNNLCGFISAGTDISNEYICYLLQRVSLGSLISSTALPALTSAALRSIPFTFPSSKREQESVVAALSDADALIESLSLLLAKKRQIKQGTMQELLTGKKRLPGFNTDWVIKRLDQLAQIRSGGTPSTTQEEFWNGNILWCTPTDITALDGYKYLRDTARKLTPLGLWASAAEKIPANSIVMTSRATIGECAINLHPVTTNQGFKSFIPIDGVDTDFLYYLLKTQRNGFVSLCAGSTFLEIGKIQLLAYEVFVPVLKEEQAAIAKMLSEMDQEIDLLCTKLNKMKKAKQGMMQALLTGRIRLVPAYRGS